MRILIVDDQEAIVKSTSIYLKTKGFQQIDTLTDSRQVLDHVSRCQPDVILLDLNMPYISGEDLITPIRTVKPDIAIFIISAIDHKETTKNCIQKGASIYFTKPINNIKLVECLNQVSIQHPGKTRHD